MATKYTGAFRRDAVRIAISSDLTHPRSITTKRETIRPSPSPGVNAGPDDRSYIWTGEGWLYLPVILDLYSRCVIGWAASKRMKRDLAIRALQMAVEGLSFLIRRHMM
jgi:transposase InsO family protein